ncbi:hypothetical protein HDF11_001250 [Tunturiibacter psychrotolerans]
MRNAFVQDWRGFWAVGGLTGFLVGALRRFCSEFTSRTLMNEKQKSKYRDPSPFDCALGQDDDVTASLKMTTYGGCDGLLAGVGEAAVFP